MNFRLWKDIEKTYDGGMSGPNPYGNDLSSLISTIRENRRREELNALNWQNQVESKGQEYRWAEKNQKLDNRFAGLLGDVGKGNKWHSLAQGAVGLGASMAGSGGFNSGGYSAEDAAVMGVNPQQAENIAKGGFTEWTTDMPVNGGVTRTRFPW